MSQSNAEDTSSELVAGVAKFNTTTAEAEVKGCMDDKVDRGSEIGEEDAENDADVVKEEEEGESETILNEDVIYKIAQFVDFADLKSLRHVNKLWSAGATREFFQKSAIFLKFGLRSEEQLQAFGAETEKLNGIRAFKLDLGYYQERYEKEAEIFQDIFASLGPTLKTLEIQSWFDDGSLPQRGDPNIPSSPHQPLSLQGFYLDKGLGLLRRLYAAAPNLTELVVKPFRPSVLTCLAADDGRRNWSLAPSLSSLALSCGFASPPFLNDLSILLSVVNFPQPWKSLDISFSPFTEDGSGLLFAVMEKNKDCLVKLDNRLGLSQTLRFPATFSKLKKLELEFSELRLVDGVVTFGGGGLVYSKAFPALSSLSIVLPKGSDTAAQIWASLFPPSQVFRGLKTLKVVGRRDIPFLPNVEVVQNLVVGIFPHARIGISLI